MGRVTLVGMPGVLCSARLRNGDPCRSVATQGEFCGYHRALAEELGYDLVANGGQTKRRNARQREPVIAESEPLELSPGLPGAPSGVRPALALAAAEELETIRRVLLDAATSTTRDSWRRVRARVRRASGRRSPFPITVRGSRRSRRCSERDSVASVRRMSSSRGCRQAQMR